MEDITDADQTHPKRVCKSLEIKNFGEYHDLCVQRDTFENLICVLIVVQICVQVFEIDPACFLTTPLISMASSLKKDSIKTRSITDIDTLLIVDKGIRSGVCHAIHRYAKTSNKYMKNNNIIPS